MEFSTRGSCQVFCCSSHTRLLKLFTSVTSHSAEDVDNLDGGVMAHEKHSVKTYLFTRCRPTKEIRQQHFIFRLRVQSYLQ